MRIELKDIEVGIEANFNLRPGTLRGFDRHRCIARPRQMAFYLARELTNASFPQIGRHFYKDHTTILHGVRKIAQLLAEKPLIAKHLQECRDVIQAANMARALRCHEAVDKLIRERGEIITVEAEKNQEAA